ncbi:MAG: hypothetical protein JKY88_02345 [Pseudomonadales bacterium]|nr:hypothetical protein [Pseudomonadales bacterium]
MCFFDRLRYTGHKSFVKSALKAAEGFRYAPAFVDGKAVLMRGVKNRIIYDIAH